MACQSCSLKHIHEDAQISVCDGNQIYEYCFPCSINAILNQKTDIEIVLKLKNVVATYIKKAYDAGNVSKQSLGTCLACLTSLHHEIFDPNYVIRGTINCEKLCKDCIIQNL